MESLLRQPVRCPILVGRASELATLVALLASAKSGAGQIILLAGEAGIGKSRLTDELVQIALTHQFVVRRGSCFEPDRAVPYAPIAELLKSEFPTSDTTQPAIELDPHTERHRRVVALRDAFFASTGPRPHLAVIEDLHWCDDASLDLIADLARDIASTPVVLLLTYRTGETPEPLLAPLAKLDRLPNATEIRLGRLPGNDAEAMVRAIFSLERPVRRDFLDALDEVTEGNPLFVEETLKSLLAAGHLFYDGAWLRHDLAELDIPRTVQDAVRRRLDELSKSARTVLDAAAIAGRRFEFDLLLAALEIDEQSLLTSVKELVAAQLLIEESPDRFAFRHALTRQAVVSQLLGRERKLLHRRIGEALEAIAGTASDQHAPDLALHFSEAGESEKTLAYGRRAGDRALALDSPRAAVEQYTRAIDAAASLGLPVDPELLRRRAAAADTLGRFDDARADLERALRLSAKANDPRAEWRTLVDLGLLWASRDYLKSGAILNDALTKARELDDPIAIARGLNRRGNWRLNVGDPLAARDDHTEALATFAAHGDQRELAATLDLLGMAEAHGGNPLVAIDHFREAARHCRELGDRRGLVSALAMLAQLGAADSRIYPSPASGKTEAAEHAVEAIRHAQEIGWRAGEAYARISLAFGAAVDGDIGASLSSAREAIAIAEEIDHRLWLTSGHASLGIAFGSLGAHEAAYRHLERAQALAESIGSVYFVAQTSVFLGWTLRFAGELDRAEGVLDRAAAMIGRPHPFIDRLMRRLRAELILARGDGTTALRIADDLIQTGEQTWGPLIVPSYQLLRGQALAALSRFDEAETALRQARHFARAHSGLPLLLDIDRALAGVYTAAGRTSDAATTSASLGRLWEQFLERVPMEPDPELAGQSLRDLTRVAHAAGLPTHRRPTPLQAAKREYGGLTAREREVAALIARGLSNRAIADELVIGERTVVSHVTNALAKLGFTSRAQIAVWAVDRGLATPSSEPSPAI